MGPLVERLTGAGSDVAWRPVPHGPPEYSMGDDRRPQCHLAIICDYCEQPHGLPRNSHMTDGS